MSTKNRVVKNTFVMYLKMILSLGVTFYSTRIVLEALGVTDFGIYNLVAGTISLLGFFNGSIANTIQRYLAFELGNGEEYRISQIFSISLNLNIIIAILMIVVLEVLGIYGFNYFFVIPIEKIGVAKVAYQIMVLTTIVSILSTPYNAAFNAHEHLTILSIVEFIESCLKLVCAYILLSFNHDRLILYCLFLLGIFLLSFIFKILYSFKQFEETKRFKLFDFNKVLLKEIIPFWGWNALEACSWLGKNQGIAVLMNTLYGTIVNAAYGIASQINGPVTFFSSTLINAIRPQIYKSSGSKDYERMIWFSSLASKLAFLALTCFIIPFSFVIHEVFKLWLTIIPDYSERFSILLLTITLIGYLSIGVNIAIQAYGNIKKYQIVTSLIILISLPIGYMIYAFSDNPYMFLYIMIFVEFISVLSKYSIASDILSLSKFYFIREITLPCLSVVSIAIPISFLLYHFINPESHILYIAIFFILDFIAIILISYFCGLKKCEKDIINSIFENILLKLNLCQHRR